MTGRFIAVVGPSGVGKDSVMQALAANEPRLTLARRTITRPPGADAEAFDSLDRDTFLAQEAAGVFVLSWAAHDLHYGIPASVTDPLDRERDVLANVSRSMLTRAAALFDPFEVISLHATRDVLAQRLAGRGRETDDQIARRLDRAAREVPAFLKAHHIDNSGDLDQTVRSVLTVLYPPGRSR